ncbi:MULTISPECIES: hypothetical protein [Ochrobactrum]|uniref:Uncharacterized protein n=1 Tax=Ochrobactrum quorumnocens TaxID=271865 RepID=A0A5N1JVY6_9HYPH|nr:MULTISPECIES: hypothetical protein [Brucella/Ochrobactrum group]KAA9368297.1 hypothetical protein F3W84_10430 [[Ochrobactrum] quorumnocens]MBD7991801.1 hypothetical protein [Ochrobactrum gallinarum]MDH7792497.1 hypothetical protein [Ochrobactrum sp. AN78]
MNVANLQIEGLCLAIAALNRALVEKGLLSRTEIESALQTAEVTARSDDRFVEDLTPAQRDAVCFPIRILLVANSCDNAAPTTFSELAKSVGETKKPYNDML